MSEYNRIWPYNRSEHVEQSKVFACGAPAGLGLGGAGGVLPHWCAALSVGSVVGLLSWSPLPRKPEGILHQRAFLLTLVMDVLHGLYSCKREQEMTCETDEGAGEWKMGPELELGWKVKRSSW